MEASPLPTQEDHRQPLKEQALRNRQGLLALSFYLPWMIILLENMEEKRRIPDRRSRPTKPFSWHSVKGLRSNARRAGEDKNYFVDRYEPRYFILISLILILCVLDAYLSLKIFQAGGKELNPFMLRIMEKNPGLALTLKYLITAFSIGILTVLKNFIIFGRVRVGFLIFAVFLLYLLLVVFEIAFYLSRIRGDAFLPS